MATHKKETWEKGVEEYDFKEMVDWITGSIIFGLARGDTLRNIIYSCIMTLMNTGKIEFKGGKK